MEHIFARCGRAARAKRDFFFTDQFFWQDGLLILMVQVSKQSFLGGLCSDRNTFSRAAGARRARSEKFSRQCFLFAEAVPTSYRTQNSVHKQQSSSGHYIYYNIDIISHKSKLL